MDLFTYIKDMEVGAIKTKLEYETALEVIASMIEAEPGSPEWDRLELLSMLVNAYEERL